MAEPVAELLRRGPPPAISSRATASTARRLGAGAHRLERRRPARSAPARSTRAPRRRCRRSRTSACSRSSRSRATTPKSTTTSVSRGISASRRGSACGRAPFSAAAMIARERQARRRRSASRAAPSRRRPRARCARSSPCSEMSQRYTSSASSAERRMAATSSGSLTARSCSTSRRPARATMPSARWPASFACARTVRCASSKPRRCAPQLPRQLGDGLEQVVAAAHHVEAGDLALRALEVAEVGQESAPLGPDQHRAVRPGEAGQVAHVHEVADQQQVDLAAPRPARRGALRAAAGTLMPRSGGRSPARAQAAPAPRGSRRGPCPPRDP